MITDIIHLLPDSVANQIAAGEVIQRPASVVKELVENSIDAGASSVQIIIKDAGRTLIQVVDDGCGMSVTDARMAFERHATSKISQATDLFTLHTMGFRGEALPSIAAVSEIEMRTQRRDDVAGTRLYISASSVENQEPYVCTPGTNIMVKRLFFNLPARRKFLKKDTIELGHIMREFERLALVNTSVEFSLSHNDIVLHHLMPGSLKQRIGELFGKSQEHQLIPVSTETSLVRINGFVCLPSSARKRGALQYFFVNGRYMRHAYFHKAVIGCYEDLIQPDTQPNYFLNLEVDPDTIDVNIHPQKYEVKFENEQPIWQIISAAIKEALGRFNASAAIDFEAVDIPNIPSYNPANKAPRDPGMTVDDNYNPFRQQRDYQKPSVPTDWEKLYSSFTQKAAAPIIDQDDIAKNEAPEMEVVQSIMQPDIDTPPMFQLRGRYIVSPSKSGIMIIDQHRAHVRILFDKYMSITRQGEIPSQRLIFPIGISLDATQSMMLSSILDMLSTMGFDICDLGGNSWSINAVPAMLSDSSPADAIINIVNAVSAADEDVEQSQWQKIALSMAKSAAIKYGTTLSTSEMDAIVSDLFHLTTPNYTPDGKSVLGIIDFENIHKLF